MNTIQKATFAVSALAITLIGGALATAPMSFARPVPVLSQGGCSTPSLQIALSGHNDCQGASRGTGLRLEADWEGRNLSNSIARTYLNGNPLLPWAPGQSVGQSVGQSESGVGYGYSAYGRTYALGLAWRY